MHLAVAEGSMGGHIFRYPADPTRRVDDDLIAFVLFTVFQEAASVYQDAKMADPVSSELGESRPGRLTCMPDVADRSI